MLGFNPLTHKLLSIRTENKTNSSVFGAQCLFKGEKILGEGYSADGNSWSIFCTTGEGEPPVIHPLKTNYFPDLNLESG